MNTLKKLLAGLSTSSVDGDKVSARVTGIILGLSAYIIQFAPALLGMTIAEQDVANFASDAGSAVGALIFIFGLVRWVYFKIHDKVLKVDSRVQ